MNIGKVMFAKFIIYRNPVTEQFATLFIHNIRHIIVTNDLTITLENGAYEKKLELLGFTEFVAESN